MKGLKYTRKYIFVRAAIYVALVLWTITAANVLWNVDLGGKDGTDKIITAFNEGTFVDMQASVSAYGEYGTVYLSQNAKNTILKNIASKVGISNYTIQNESEDNTFTTTLSQNGVNGDVICKVITVETKEGQNVIQAKQYVYVNVILNTSVQSAFTYEQIVKEVMRDLEIDTKVTVNLKGEIEGRLDMALRNSIADQLIDTVGAKVVVENKSDDMYTIYAYTSDIDDYITIGSSKINVNISMNYDETNNITNVYLSTPINSEDY